MAKRSCTGFLSCTQGCKSILKNAKIKSIFDGSAKSKEIIDFNDTSEK